MASGAPRNGFLRLVCFLAALALSAPVRAAGGWQPITLPDSESQFHFPERIAVDGAGNVFICDYSPTTTRLLLKTIQGESRLLAEEGKELGQIHDVKAIVVDGAGNLYVGENDPLRIQKRSPEGIWSDVSDNLFNDYRSKPALLDLAVDSAGNLFVGFVDTERFIRKRDLLGNWTTEQTINYTQAPYNLSYNFSLDVDEQGNLYAVEMDRILKRDLSNKWSVLYCRKACQDNAIYSSEDGYLRKGYLDSKGFFYLSHYFYDEKADVTHVKIERLDTQSPVSTINPSVLVDDAINGYHDQLSDLTISPRGQVYYSFSGAVHRLTNPGNPTNFYSTPPVPGQIYYPESLTVDGSGNLYVADTDNNRVQKRDTEGNWTVVAAPGEGVGRVKAPDRVCTDVQDNLYVRSATASSYKNQKRDTSGNWVEWPQNAEFPCAGALAPAGLPGSTQEVTDSKGNIFYGVPGSGGQWNLYRWDRTTGATVSVMPAKGVSAEIGNVAQLICDPWDRLYVGYTSRDTGYYKVIRRNTDSTWVRVPIPADGESGYTLTPEAMDVDRYGNLYLLQRSYLTTFLSLHIRKLHPEGRWDDYTFLPKNNTGIIDVDADARGNLYILLGDNQIYYSDADHLQGDLDRDGEITVRDAVVALQIAVGALESTPERLDTGDMDGDGAVTVWDAASIMRGVFGFS